MKQLCTFGKDSLFYLLLVTIFSLFVYSKNLSAQTPGTAPYPNFGSATVDGNNGEWDTATSSLDWFAHMYRSGDASQPLETELYLRYDCTSSTMYVLVMQANSNIPLLIQSGEAFVKIDGNKVVEENYGSPNFAWVGAGYDLISNHAQGWEAKFPLTSPGTYDIEVHVNVFDDNEEQTSDVDNRGIDLIIDCSLPVEMTSFSVKINNNFAELNWETATEVNNYGFEIQRSENNENAWEKIGFVNGHGNSNSPKSYSFKDKSLNEAGKYYYKLKQIDVDGSYVYSDVAETSFGAPVEYKLSQNFPNPFNPTTTISFSIPQAGYVSLKVYDMLGNEVAEIFRGNKAAGNYNYQFDASKLASGVYIYKLQAGEFISAKRLILLK